jgi:hypothetical protein
MTLPNESVSAASPDALVARCRAKTPGDAPAAPLAARQPGGAA